MALNYAEKWQNELLQILIQGSLTSPFVTSNVRWLDAKTFHFTQMSVGGYKNHSRNGGWNRGEFNQTDVPFTIQHDRDIEFLVDKADVDETGETAKVENISSIFVQTQMVPETDALFFEKVAKAAKAADAAYHTETAAGTYTKAKVYGMLKAALKPVRKYRARGSLVMYVSSDIMDALEQSTDFTRKIEMTQIAEGGLGIESRITEIDGVPVIEVLDENRFYDDFKYDEEAGGFKANTGAHKINVLIACLETCKTVPKISSIYFFAPGTHTEGDGYLYQNRAMFDTFVFPNGLDGKVDSVFVDTDTVAVE